MEVEGLAPTVDTKLWPGGGRAWDWRETGTHHVPGIQVADVAELLENGARIRVQVAETNEAAEIYNRLAARDEPVGGLFHSTC